ncbi:hypothetical protein [Burkholderia territorii]|uniref:Uncharacterized protein n=1 Tax=Burkholderia territorii TaxID=1503055 RepID=A0A6L3NR75_9BURK|nr:hypothetical protein [Burkholderia territorii]KAB0686525.1 hypothetical protein F7R13_00075 [Burkholderia territorii]MBM2776831.1 hypothetical protein [Burkholderia territorii]VWB60164.1 hypothetical protein BTE28158_02791 [Burkholderia territorii]
MSVLDELTLCRRALLVMSNVEFDGGSVRGAMVPTHENRKLFSDMQDASLAYPNQQFLKATDDVARNIELSVPRRRDCFCGASLDDLLDSQVWSSYEAPANFYLADEDVLCSSQDSPSNDRIKSYFSTLRAISLLQMTADYEDRSTGGLRLVFLQREKIEVPVALKASDIRTLSKVDNWLAMMSEALHKEQRKSIFRTILSDALKGAEAGDRLHRFIAQFDELYQRFVDNYELYIAEFSVEKIVQENVDKKFDYIVKITKTFSDIQNQILAIPVAVVLAGSQMGRSNGVTLKNVVVLAGIYVFAVLMALLVRNQLATLAALGDEIRAQKALLEKKAKVWPVELTAMYADLGRREVRQRRLLWFVDGLVAVSVAGSTVLFLYFSGLLKLG